MRRRASCALSWLLLAACAGSSCAADGKPSRRAAALQSALRHNRGAYIPSACFARVDDARGAHNPCYVCHARGQAPNHVDELELQLRYDFPQLVAGRAVENPWLNLFKDRRAEVAGIPDDAVLAYVSRSNYESLRPGLHEEWDLNGNGRWDGYSPDAAFAFDSAGWDRAADGGATGWRAFRYAPLPGTFLPQSGSFDDVAIRLPAAFRADESGSPSERVYAINLAVVEALITRRDVAIDAVDERALGVDLDRDGQLSAANVVRYAWRDGQPGSLQYVGRAEQLRREGSLSLAPGLYPQGTEFLHSVRYLGVDASGGVVPAARMKELRYARKHTYLTYAELADQAQREQKESELNPDRPEQFAGDAERGLVSPLGWSYQGFIEDASGALRPQSYEETLSCMGCHSGLGVTTDGSFAFPRLLADGPAHGFGDRATGYGAAASGEYARYLRLNATGDPFGSNLEVRERFFDVAGAPRPDAFAQLAHDVSRLLVPSRERALALDRAYWTIVREQSFALGRDPTLEPVELALRQVEPGQVTGIHEALEP